MAAKKTKSKTPRRAHLVAHAKNVKGRWPKRMLVEMGTKNQKPEAAEERIARSRTATLEAWMRAHDGMLAGAGGDAVETIRQQLECEEGFDALTEVEQALAVYAAAGFTPWGAEYDVIHALDAAKGKKVA